MTFVDPCSSPAVIGLHPYPADAPSSVVASDVHRALREEAIENDAIASEPVPLALFWRALTRGVCRVVDTFFTSSRCYVVTAGLAGQTERAVCGRTLLILERILSGASQKSLALDLGLAPSTIALNARVGLRNMGIGCKPSRVHPLLMLAAKAAHDRDLSVLGSMSVVFPNGVSLRAVGFPRPDAQLANVLPPGELAVIRALIEGRSYEDIAHQRGASQRTVANQIAKVFQRVRVSGRNDLVHRLFAESPMQMPTVPPPFSPIPDWEPLEMAAS